jgi:hypothetical protein
MMIYGCAMDLTELCAAALFPRDTEVDSLKISMRAGRASRKLVCFEDVDANPPSTTNEDGWLFLHLDAWET